MQEQNNFKYIYKGKEVSKEQFNTLAKNVFKWFNDNSVNAVGFEDVSNFFDGGFKSQAQVNTHFKGILDGYNREKEIIARRERALKQNNQLNPILQKDAYKNEFYITPPSKENLEKMCNSFEERVKQDSDKCGIINKKEYPHLGDFLNTTSDKCGDINYAVPECKSKFGKKEVDGKLNYELDWEFIQQMAERMSHNKGKYEPFNWKRLMDVEKLKQSLFRHVIEIMKGNYSDDGRAAGHLESVALNALFINYQLKNNLK